MNLILILFGGQRCFSFLTFSVTMFLVPNAMESYLVVAPKTVRPGTLYGVVIQLVQGQHTALRVRADISRQGVEVVSAAKTVVSHQVDTIFMKVPLSSVSGRYSLKVEGYLPDRLGERVFVNETEVIFSTMFLSIVIQTSRPIYNSGQLVYFRVILLTAELLPYDDAVEIYILDSDNFIMRRWVSVQLNSGVVSHKFKLPKLAKPGFWKIQVKAGEQVQEQPIRVEAYFPPQFEVQVLLPMYIVDSEEEIKATITAKSELQRIVTGNASLALYGRNFRNNGTFILIWQDKVFLTSGNHELVLPMETVRSVMNTIDGVELRLEAEVSEFLYGETVSGFSHTRIINSSINIHFLGTAPKIFKPGMPFEGHIVVAYHDKERLSEEKLSGSKIRIDVSAQTNKGGSITLPPINTSHDSETLDDHDGESNGLITGPSLERYRKEGILYFKFDVPEQAVSQLTISAEYRDEEGVVVRAQITALEMFAPHGKRIGLWTSTRDAQTGEFAVFHVKSNFYLEEFQYLIVSKNLILYAGQQNVEDMSRASVKTFAVPIGANMAPAFTLIVYHITPLEVVADSVFVPVNGFQGYACYVELNQGKDHTKKTAEAIMPADAGAFMGIHAQRSASYFMQAGNDISKSRVVDSFFLFENFTRSEPKVVWRSRQGLVPDESVYLTSMNDGVDTHQTFTLANLAVFTDAHVPARPRTDVCDTKEGYVPCFTEGCFLESKKCDGHTDCEDGSDEYRCVFQDDQYEYRVLRRSISSELYDVIGKEWAWQEMNGEYGGEEFFRMIVPPIIDDYYFTAFSVSKTLGFTSSGEPVPFSTVRPFMMHLVGPSACHRGEQVGLRLLLLNNEPYEMLVLITLHSSPHYKFVHVEMNGIVTSYGARLEDGDHQHMVYLAPGLQKRVDLPIAPMVEQGNIEVKVTAVTQVGRSERLHVINVLPEGGTITKHTSTFLDLKNRALVLQYLDIVVEESPIVPYQDWRRYIFGSPRGTMTLSGDVIGPMFPEIPLTTKTMLRREMKGTEAKVFELAANIWTLHYLRLTNQLGWETAREVLEEANALFGQVMKRCDKEGWFKNWDNSQPSVWLTAWVIRIFKHASFPDWENHLFIDPVILTKSVGWLLHFQTELGSFKETDHYLYPLDFKMYAKFSADNSTDTTMNNNVPLTSHLVITLQEVLPLVQGGLKTQAAAAALKAVRYLEQVLSTLSDPYEIAITTYALTLTESSRKNSAFNLLHKTRRQGIDGQLYWSREPIPDNNIKYENQRPFLKHREFQEGDSLAVEATSFALMVYLIRDGVTMIPETIVQWLTSVRMTNNGFISTIDTVIALQALTEYSFRARIKDITNMDITMELPSSAGFRENMHITNKTLSEIHSLEIPNVWGHANVIARGSGQAILQMDISYGVDSQTLAEAPKKKSFELEINEFYSSYRNKSSITIQSCFKWVRHHPVMSGAAVLEVEIPTGYHLIESEATMIVQSGVLPTLQDARTIEGKTIWFFDHITSEWSCFNHTIRRWFPVANMTLYRQAFLYDAFAREHFVQTIFNSTPLYIMSICEVCGSYQCPYCPFYSDANHRTNNSITCVLCIFITALFWLFHTGDT